MPEFDYQLLKIPSRIYRFLKPIGLLACLLTVAFLGVTDYLTGSELSFSIFYLIPISFATLFSGRMAGIIVSLISAAAWFIADLAAGHQYSHPLIPYWNSAVRLGYFTVHTMLLTILLSYIDKMKAMALHDPLTGASNWRFFEETARREVERMRRSRKSLTLSYIDIDNFKQVNDTFGHGAGDDLLRTIVDTIQKSIRPTDLLARAGGDEFAVLFPDTDKTNGNAIFSRIRENFNKAMAAYAYPVTMSIGAVTFTVLPSSVEAMIKRADELMYSVKKHGKNNLKHEEWPGSAIHTDK